MSQQVQIRLRVNGDAHEVAADARTLLVDLIRDELGLTGTHVGCRTGHCGACTVVLDGRVSKSCTVLAAAADGAEVTTIEGLAADGVLHPVQEALWQEHGVQCGFCTPGMVLAAAELLAENRSPVDDEIRRAIAGNLCRCTGYENIVNAIRRASAS
ncbi:MAG: (2Fe-2S)-binding protein [Actinomycetia bacterium]|nr:(2Fe-2S)-binding protein [Actinomycetes bacterium]